MLLLVLAYLGRLSPFSAPAFCRYSPLSSHVQISRFARVGSNITNDRLYPLIRQGSALRDRIFRIEFLSPGVQAYAFTFGSEN